MNHLLFSLVLGAGLISGANLLLYRFSTLSATPAAVLVALAALGIYVPLAVVSWPGGDVLAIHLAVYLLTSLVCGLFLGLREQNRVQGKSNDRRWHWGPALIVGFFICLLIVDSVFIILAERGLSPQLSTKLLPDPQDKGKVFSSFPGVISHDFQKKEALYNAYLLQVKRQQERGWQIRKGWLSQPVLGEPATLKVVAKDRLGNPLTDAVVRGQFLRPSDSRLDTDFTMQEQQPGVYQAELKLPAAGLWNLVLQLRKHAELHEIRASTSVLAQ
jgi:nitrogen fixation protein FixH